MANEQTEWPRKTREFANVLCDSRAWNDFVFSDGDIVIATLPRSGTTLTQQIVGQLVFDGVDGLFGGPSAELISPWLDARWTTPDVRAAIDAQTHRRFLKTHLPLDALVFSPKAKYLYVARDQRDAIWSQHNFYLVAVRAAPPEQRRQSEAALAQRFGPDWTDVRCFYRAAVAIEDGWGWAHVRTWWEARRLPNVLLVHYNNLTARLESEMRRIAAFLDIPIKEEAMPRMLEHCSLAYMRAIAGEELERAFKGDATELASSFFHRGTNSRWKDVLSPQEIALCDEAADKYLPPDCAHWLKTGELPKEKD